MNYLLLTIVLQIACLVIIILELMLPSGGILAIVAAGLLASSWFLIADLPYTWAPTVFFIFDLIFIPLTIYFGLKWMRYSPLSNRDELSSAAGFQVQSDLPTNLVGQTASVLSTLRPSGKIIYQGTMYEAISHGDFINQGTQVTILSVSENKILVEAYHESSEQKTQNP